MKCISAATARCVVLVALLGGCAPMQVAVIDGPGGRKLVKVACNSYVGAEACWNRAESECLALAGEEAPEIGCYTRAERQLNRYPDEGDLTRECGLAVIYAEGDRIGWPETYWDGSATFSCNALGPL